MYNYNNFQAQTESVAGPTIKKSKQLSQENHCAQGFPAFDAE
jgi:hypothetical protein